MTEEVQNLAEVDSAPAPEVTATIKRIAYYPQRLTNAELQAITK